MLKKLIKHEFKATYRTFIPIYIGLVILVGAACLFMELLKHFDQTTLTIGAGFGMIIVILGLIFVFISPYIFLSMRFYRTTATREAYLTFTVPADTKIILLAKFIVSYIWTILTVILGYLGISILLSEGKVLNIAKMFEMLFEGSSALLIIVQILSFLIGFATTVLHIFASVSLGQLVRDHRVIASLAFYAALYTVQQIVSVVVLLPYMVSELSTARDMGNADGFTAGFSMGFESSIQSESVSVFVISLIVSLVFGAVFYFLSNHLLKKKLNLL